MAYYLFTDHLGSTVLMASQNAAKNQLEPVTGSRATYYPFGDYRGLPPTQTLTDRGFTGQKSNNQPSADLGLLYYNARYYAPGIARFISADTIVPDPANPQAYNRYSYVQNAPLNRIDPTGHIDCDSGVLPEDDAQSCNGNNVTPHPPVTTIGILQTWMASGIINDPHRNQPLQVPIVIDGVVVGTIYVMPVGREQSADRGIFEPYGDWIGRRGNELSIGLDVIELILAGTPEVGAGIGAGWLDASVTWLSGMFSGENYFPGINQHPDLPPMIAINQDVLINGGEAVVGGTAPLAFSMLGLATTVETGPAGILVGGGTGFMTGKMVDAITSFTAAIYDYGRYNGTFQNHLSVGIAGEGFVIVYWP